MSRKYIAPINNNNFIFPNNDPSEYGVEIIHDINDYSVSGTVTNFTATTISSTNIIFRFNFSWSLNNAEPFIRDSNNLSILSLHSMVPGQTYYKPWRISNTVASTNLAITGFTISGFTTGLIPSQFGLTSFINGEYNFEVRFIGHRAISPVCISYTISSLPAPPTPTPTATPTPTPTGPTPTPTPTPTSTPVVQYYTGATLYVTDTGWIKYNSQTNGPNYYAYIGSLGYVNIPDCAVCTSFAPGIPYSDTAAFSVINCGTLCP